MPVHFLYFTFAMLAAGPAIAKDFLADLRDRLSEASEWSELCEITDCSRFPAGYHTYAFGSEVYYFPTMATMTVKPPNVLSGGVKSGRLFEVDGDGELLRSVSIAPTTTIANCCHHLLTFYGLAEAFPKFRESRNGNRMPSAFASISSHDYTGPYNIIRRWLGRELGQFPRIEEVISPETPSYNADFWVIDAGEPNAQGFRPFRLLSKRPLFHGRHVFALCEKDCTFGSMSFAGSEDETRPNIELRWMLLTGENMFLCSFQETVNGCDPSPDAFDEVTVMFSVLEDMFETASSYTER